MMRSCINSRSTIRVRRPVECGDSDVVGGSPRLIFKDEAENELKTIDISDGDTASISTILEEHGFFKVDEDDHEEL